MSLEVIVVVVEASVELALVDSTKLLVMLLEVVDAGSDGRVVVEIETVVVVGLWLVVLVVLVVLAVLDDL